MSDLPGARSAVFDPPFTHAGVDYLGPTTIKRGKRTRPSTGTDKRTRGIHLELAGDLSTDCF